PPIRFSERDNYKFFLDLPEADRTKIKLDVKGTQLLEPLFEYSGACSGCGETPYIKLLTQLYGDRALIANATGCSSIFGGNLPSTPYTCNAEGRGPSWSNSLFEDNAEFGFGMRLAVDKQEEHAKEILATLGTHVGDELVKAILEADQTTEAGIQAQRERVVVLRQKLAAMKDEKALWLSKIADYLVKKSVWIVGGDGWAYDIGYGGLDHVIASGRNVNILVLDTEVYSNTGGQASKSTPIGAAAKFATAGKAMPKKDLAMLAMSYGHPYVARVALGAKDAQTVNAFKEADSYNGVSVIIAYSHCIAHGYDLADALGQQEKAVESGYWPLFRYDPRKVALGESPLKMDSSAPKGLLNDFLSKENRFKQVQTSQPEQWAKFLAEAERGVKERFALYEQMAKALHPQNLVPGAAAANGKPKAQA
ncbi:MAG: thiamine pyrophosphate-dependent enzyme, partial [Anaeromyxobacteraceae bacterium]